ncbi:MAG: hypothetical protein ACRDWY_06980 [Actinomycetes bacterium]
MGPFVVAVDGSRLGQWLPAYAAGVANAQVWTLIGLLAAAMFTIVVEMRRTNDRLNDRMTDGFTAVRAEIADLRVDVRGDIAGVRADIAELRHDFRGHEESGHRPSA